MDNEQLVSLIRNGEDVTENMLQLWQNNQRFVKMLAVKFTYGAELEDLIQEGYIALYEAVRHYDISSGVPFINYAAFWIKHVFRRYIENCGGTVRIPPHVQESIKKYKRIANEYRKYYGRDASDREMRAFLGVSEEKLTQIKKAAQMGQIRSLSEPIGDEDDHTLADTVASNEDMEEDVIRKLDMETMQRELWIAVDSLPEIQSAVVRHRYQKGNTLKETGEKLGLTYSQASDAKNKAMRALRMPGKSRKYRKYYGQYLSAATIHHVGVRSFQRTWTSEVEREVFGW